MKNKTLLAKIYDIDKKFLGKGSVDRISPNFIRIKGHHLPSLKSHTDIYINIFDELRGISVYRCEVSLAADMQLSARIIRKEKQIERRKSLKIRTNIKTNAQMVLRNSRAVESDFPIELTILNLSIGGMLFTSKTTFYKDDTVLFVFDYMKKHPFTIEAQVIRIDKAINEYEYDNYGCQFKGLNPFEEKIVMKYLYEQQLRTHKK